MALTQIGDRLVASGVDINFLGGPVLGFPIITASPASTADFAMNLPAGPESEQPLLD